MKIMPELATVFRNSHSDEIVVAMSGVRLTLNPQEAHALSAGLIQVLPPLALVQRSRQADVDVKYGSAALSEDDPALAKAFKPLIDAVKKG